MKKVLIAVFALGSMSAFAQSKILAKEVQIKSAVLAAPEMMRDGATVLGYNNGEIENSRIRYVLYKPYMSGKSTGLPTKPQAPGMPWLMDADTHRSHIMISPANK